MHSVNNFITHNIGSKFVEPPILQFHTILEESNKRSPLIFILSPGVDPASKLQQLAEDKQMASSRYYTLSLGQGQAPTARKLLEAGMKKVSAEKMFSTDISFCSLFALGSLDISSELSSIDQLVAWTGQDRRTITECCCSQWFSSVVELVTDQRISCFHPTNQLEDYQRAAKGSSANFETTEFMSRLSRVSKPTWSGCTNWSLRNNFNASSRMKNIESCCSL